MAVIIWRITKELLEKRAIPLCQLKLYDDGQDLGKIDGNWIDGNDIDHDHVDSDCVDGNHVDGDEAKKSYDWVRTEMWY